jgi:NADH-quinone oxidoreductase subunit N
MSPPSSLAAFQQTAIVLVPEFILLATAVVMMTASAFISWRRQAWCAVSAAALIAALLALFNLGGHETELYSAVALNDNLSFYGRIVLLLAGLVVIALAHDEPPHERAGEFFGSLLIMNAGAMAVAAANELVFLFIGLELVSMPTYLLLYLSRRTRATQEAAIKYFLLSIFASGLFLYGLTFLYGSTGISNLKALAYFFGETAIPHPQLGLLAVVFVLAGLCFRVAAVPLHFYAPDVYEGSPMVIAALLSWVPKAVGILAIVRTLTAVLATKGVADPLLQKAIWLCWIIAAATMVLGNFVALLQDNLKRLLAYSSIAHAGYLMVGVTAAFANDREGGRVYFGSEGVFFYLVAYALMTLGLFGGLLSLRSRDRVIETVDDLTGLGWSHPWTALAIATCLLSLTGIPPLAGFWGKFQIFASLLAAAQRDFFGPFVTLAVIGMLSAAAGAYYYLRIVVLMYFRPSRERIQVAGGWPVTVAVGACAILTVLVGLYSSPVAGAAHAAAESALSHPMLPGSQIAAAPATAGLLSSETPGPR